MERHFPLANEQNLPLHTTTENKRNHRNHSSQRHHRPAYPSSRLRKLDKYLDTPRREKENTQKASNEKFRLFWDDYHNILQLPKENIAKAQRIWKKLSEKEQQLAIDHIEEYYYHQTNMKFTLHACSYLSNKAFLNEYEH
ncbi:hypothetical protein NXX89_13680 [Bacteroides thetaiotaomicron]|nr:hypothetical protein [Bacteroides thetaiotaomicron]MCS3212442.1 hypothetical protein [Bacteroides thetaiotaomicron]